MKGYKQWVCWRLETLLDGTKTKIPYNIKTAHKASVNDPNSWVTFEDAVMKLQDGFYTGIGFVLTTADPFCFIDLDNPKDFVEEQERAEIFQRQIKIYDEFESYSERSPSGKGLHIICKGAVKVGRKRSYVEVYSQQRFMTMTGEQYGSVTVINDRSELVNVLYKEMGGKANHSVYVEEEDQTITDEELYNKIVGAKNGLKAHDLITGNWIAHYPSQSEADFALINIISYYSKNRAQIMRCFRYSKLAERKKANRDKYLNDMITYSFDRMLPKIDIEGLKIQMEAAIAESQGATRRDDPANSPQEYKLETVAAGMHPAKITSDIGDWPPGITGEIARYFYHSSPRQIKDIAIVAALAFMAGVTGRAYNISGTGLNQYILLLAGTGTGKDSMGSGMSRLVSSVMQQIPVIDDYIGPSGFASGSALIKDMVKKPSCVAVIGEFGLRLQRMEDPRRNSSELQLKEELLDFYSKSGQGEVKRPLVYSDKSKDTMAIRSPALTILGESVPGRFYKTLTEDMVLQGFIPRFLIVEYKGKVPDLNMNREMVPSNELKNNLCDLVDTAAHLNAQQQAFNVPTTDEAQASLMEFSKFCTAKVNVEAEDASKQLWNRAHLKLLRLCALLAVGENWKNPIISIQNVTWAKNLILTEINNIISKFKTGEIGEDNKETKQEDTFKKAIFDYCISAIKKPAEEKTAMETDLIISKKVIDALRNQPCFKDDYRGSTNALERTIKNFVERGSFREVPKTDLRAKYQYYGRGFAVLNPMDFGL